MALFNIKEDKFSRIEQIIFDNENSLHKIINKNLDVLFNCYLIKDEHPAGKYGRIETLAIDNDFRPVVIEYKKDKDKCHLSQVNRYLQWMLDNQEDFKKLVNDKLPDFDAKIKFESPRIICIAKDYSHENVFLSRNLMFEVELYKYKYYNHIIEIEKIEYEVAKKSGTKGNEDNGKKSEEERLERKPKEIKDTYYKLNEMVLEISSSIKKHFTIAETVYSSTYCFLNVNIQQKCLKLTFRTQKGIEFIDEKNITVEVPKKFNWGNYNRQLTLLPSEIGKKYDWDYVKNLIIQSYRSTE